MLHILKRDAECHIGNSLREVTLLVDNKTITSGKLKSKHTRDRTDPNYTDPVYFFDINKWSIHRKYSQRGVRDSTYRLTRSQI